MVGLGLLRSEAATSELINLTLFVTVGMNLQQTMICKWVMSAFSSSLMEQNFRFEFLLFDMVMF